MVDYKLDLTGSNISSTIFVAVEIVAEGRRTASATSLIQFRRAWTDRSKSLAFQAQ